MPGSVDVFDRMVWDVFREIGPGTVLDVGAGYGKYSRIVRAAIPGAHLTAIEVHRPYIEKFQLSAIYDEVWEMNVVELLERRVACNFEVTILGDVLEHLRRSDGLDMLDYFFYRSGYVIVVYPEEWVQEECFENPLEAHVSYWTPEDFARFRPVVRVSNGQVFVMFDGLYRSEKPGTHELTCLAGS